MTTIADLRSSGPGAGPQYVTITEHSSPGDGGGGTFTWIATGSPPADNNGTIIVPPASGGYWKRLFSGAHDVRWFGAKGDGATDDTAAIQGAIEAARVAGVGPGGAVYLPAVGGDYRTNAPLYLYSGMRLFGDTPGSATANGSIIQALPSFVGDAMIRMKTRRQNWGVALENLSLYAPLHGTAPSLVNVVDWSGVLTGRIVGVTIRTADGIMRANTVGLLFSGDDGTSPDLATTYANVAENINIDLVSTAVRFKTDAVGGMTLCRLSNFYLQQCDVAIRLETVDAGFGLVFLDGYVNPNAGGKLLSVSSNGGPLQSSFKNVQWESAGNPTSDIPLATLEGWYDWLTGPSLTTLCYGVFGVGWIRYVLLGYSGYPDGESSATPMTPTSPVPSSSPSMWCRLPAGTVLNAGKTSFKFYCALGINLQLLKDLVPKVCPISDGGLSQPFSFVVGTSFSPLPLNPADQALTYTVSIYLTTPFVLTSDLDFFLDVAQTAPARNHERIQTGYDSSP
jgi:hypothetical protein